MFFTILRTKAIACPLAPFSDVFSQVQRTRQLFTSLNFIFNRVSKSRVDEVGADRACAEWLMRNGAFVRWEGDKNFVPSYNALPLEPNTKGNYRITEVTADNASIDIHGFPHFNGCKHVKSIKMKDCLLVDDECLECLAILIESLNHMEIIRCNEITDKGLMHLSKLLNLKSLRLGELSGVENLKDSVKALEKSLPSCKIETITELEEQVDGQPGQ